MRNTLMLGAAAFAVASFGLGAAAPSFAGPGEIILAQDRTSPGTPGTAPKGPSAADQKAEEAARERMERLKSAQPAAQAHITAEALMGTEVRNTADKKVGSIKDLVVSEGKIVAVVVARGGVLGMGTDYHQIDWANVKITSDAKTVVLDLAEEQVKSLPKVAYKDGKWTQVVEEKAPPSTAPGAPPSSMPKRTEPPAKTE